MRRYCGVSVVVAGESHNLVPLCLAGSIPASATISRVEFARIQACGEPSNGRPSREWPKKLWLGEAGKECFSIDYYEKRNYAFKSLSRKPRKKREMLAVKRVVCGLALGETQMVVSVLATL